MRIILDTDPGLDDAMTFVLASVLTDIVGITTVAGNVSLENATRNALALVSSLDMDCPVVSGAHINLSGDSPNAAHIHGVDGLGGIRLPAHNRLASGSDVTEFLLRSSREVNHLWIVSIGPLTNIALAIERDKDFANRIAGISMMGGSSTHGNVTSVAEFNVWADPEAADIVLNSGATIKMSGLNLTHQLKSSDSWLRGLPDTKRSNMFRNFARALHDTLETLTGQREAALHDPCALLALTHPSLFTFQSRRVDVELSGKHTRGMTIVESRPSRAQDTGNVLVGYELETNAVLQLIGSSL